MKTQTTRFAGAHPGFSLPASDGDVVSGTVPAGCVCRRDDNSEVALPHTHSGAATRYRIDCDNYTAPVTAVLTIN